MTTSTAYREHGGEDMDGRAEKTDGHWTRARLLRGMLGGGAVIAGGAAIGSRSGGISLASPSKDTDAEILRLFLLLERVQEAFYRAARERSGLEGDLLSYAEAVGRQESEHVAFLGDRVDSGAARPRDDFGAALGDPERFQRSAVALEEATIAAYVGQGANLTRPVIAAIAPMVSVEARQAAWIRDLAGISPAPRAADPAREPRDVLADLRKRGFIE
jgi:hypothetical protein